VSKRWEYRRDFQQHAIDYESTDAIQKRAEELMAWMNEMGKDGWELIHYNAGAASNQEWVFTLWKRELNV
jgi:hypothetical protein